MTFFVIHYVSLWINNLSWYVIATPLQNINERLRTLWTFEVALLTCWEEAFEQSSRISKDLQFTLNWACTWGGGELPLSPIPSAHLANPGLKTFKFNLLTDELAVRWPEMSPQVDVCNVFITLITVFWILIGLLMISYHTAILTASAITFILLLHNIINY